MNILNISKEICYKEIKKEAGAHETELSNIKRLVFKNISKTSYKNSMYYNYCFWKLEDLFYFNNITKNNLEKTKKYFMFLIDSKNDLNVDELSAPEYIFLFLYSFYENMYINDKKLFEDFFTTIFNENKLFCRTLNINKCKENIKNILLALESLFSINSQKTNYFKLNASYENKLLFLNKIISFLYKSLINENENNKRFLFSEFIKLNVLCPFYFNLENLNEIIVSFKDDKKTNNYNELLFRYAVSMKNKDYYNQQMKKFKNENDLLNNILWSNKYKKDIINACIYNFFKK